MKIFIIQEKGGVGKSYLTKILSLKAGMDNVPTYFVDADNASESTTFFFEKIADRKGGSIFFAKMNILGDDKTIDRTKFDLLIDTLEGKENFVVDFGAASSEQLLHYFNDYRGGFDLVKAMGIKLFVIIAGGGSVVESVSFLQKLGAIDGIKDILRLVANEVSGGVNGTSVKEYLGESCNVQIDVFTGSVTSSAFVEWSDMLKAGVIWGDLEKLSLSRRHRIKEYLHGIFEQINKAV